MNNFGLRFGKFLLNMVAKERKRKGRCTDLEEHGFLSHIKIRNFYQMNNKVFAKKTKTKNNMRRDVLSRTNSIR
jgi:hypothetical protein